MNTEMEHLAVAGAVIWPNGHRDAIQILSTMRGVVKRTEAGG